MHLIHNNYSLTYLLIDLGNKNETQLLFRKAVEEYGNAALLSAAKNGERKIIMISIKLTYSFQSNIHIIHFVKA